MVELTKAQRNALECLPWEFGREVPTAVWRAEGVGFATMGSLLKAGLVADATYANGRFWRITDAGRAALTGSDKT